MENYIWKSMEFFLYENLFFLSIKLCLTELGIIMVNCFCIYKKGWNDWWSNWPVKENWAVFYIWVARGIQAKK